MHADARTAARTRLHGMDGFRALAAIAIICFHAYLATSWATSGSAAGATFVDSMPRYVDGAFRNLTLRTNVFFVLSGLLLALPFVRWALVPDEDRPGIRRFAIHRVRRIWPLYLLLMPLAAATVTINSTSVEQVIVNALLLQNVAPNGTYLLPPTWTLTVELGFYLLLPIAMLLVAPLVRRLGALPARASALAIVPLAGIAIGCVVRRSGDLSVGGAELRTTVLGYMDNFAAGMLAAIVFVAAMSGRGRLARRVRALPPLAWTIPGTALVAFGLFARWDALEGRTTTAWWWVAAVATGIACWMLAVGLRPDRSWLARVLGAPLLMSIGQLAYGLFLWHYIVLHWMSVAGVTRDGGLVAVLVNIAIVLVVTCPLAWATWHLVERPFLEGRVKLPRPSLPAGLFTLGPRPSRPLAGLASPGITDARAYDDSPRHVEPPVRA